MTRKGRRNATIAMKDHPLPIRNLTTTTMIDTIHTAKKALKMRGTVTRALYRKCRISDRTRSTHTVAKVRTDAPDVIHPVVCRSISNVQRAV